MVLYMYCNAVFVFGAASALKSRFVLLAYLWVKKVSAI